MSKRYCRCGHPLQLYPSLYGVWLSDDLKGSPTQGREVINCPRCGRTLLPRTVTKEPPGDIGCPRCPTLRRGRERTMFDFGRDRRTIRRPDLALGILIFLRYVLLGALVTTLVHAVLTHFGIL